MKENWNFGLLYKNDKDPQIEKDLKASEAVLEKFEKKYRGKDFASSSKKLLTALNDYRDLERILNGDKPWRYFYFRTAINSQDTHTAAKLAQCQARLTAAKNKVAFFELELSKIAKAKQNAYVRDPLLSEYQYLLKKIFERAAHNLSEGEEQISSLLGQPGYSMWVKGQEKLLSSQTVEHEGNTIPLAQATNMMLTTANKKKRYELNKKIVEKFKATAHFAEAEINAVYTFKKIMDERRGFKHPYSATVLSYENDEMEVETLISLVTRAFRLSHRFYKIHAKLLGEKKITHADRGVKIGEIKKKFDFETSVELVRRAFRKADPKFEKILESFLKNGQIDVYPKKGKRDGAFCASGGDNPTFVFLNHTDSIRSMETLAHEMGHAFHSELTKESQPYHYRDYSTATAEVASTFFEQIVGEELEKELSEKEYMTLLHNRISGDMSTIFRQIAFFNFELDLHTKIRKEGMVSKEDMAKLMAKHLKSYMGPVADILDEEGYFFVNLSHMRRFFYVYSYAYGQIVSRALFEKWKEDPSYIAKVEKFLRAGGSKSPRDIFKSIGIDTSDPKFFQTGLKAIEKDIEKLEKLTNSN